MLFGLGIGLVVAAGVYFRRAPSPADHVAASTEPAGSREPRSERPRGAEHRRAARPRASAEAAKTSDQRFDFYDILPQYEVVVPEVESTRRHRRAQGETRRRARQLCAPGRLVRRGRRTPRGSRPTLALLGIESRVQKVAIDDDVYHRVRIGPITDLDKLNRIRRQLHDAHINAMLMKVPP